MTRRLYILGASGNSLDAIDTARDVNTASGSTCFEVAGVLDDAPCLAGTLFGGVPVIGPLAAAAAVSAADPDAVFVNGIGSTANHWRRDAITAVSGLPRDRFATLIHPSASVSTMARVGAGCLFFRHVATCAEATIGDHVIVLSNSTINHHSHVEDYSCLATAVCISGHARVGRGAYLGANSCLHPHVSIGARSLVGMGAVVLDNVAEDMVVVGNPARVLRPRTA